MALHAVAIDPSEELPADEQHKRIVRYRRLLASEQRGYAAAVERDDHADAAEAAHDLSVLHTKLAAALLGHDYTYVNDQGEGGR